MMMRGFVILIAGAVVPVALGAQQAPHPRGLQPFGSDSALSAYLTALAPPPPPPPSRSGAGCAPPRVNRVTRTARHAPDSASTIITGRVGDSGDAGVGGAQVTLVGAGGATVADSLGRFALRVDRPAWSAAGVARVRVQYIGYEPAEISSDLGPGDSLDIGVVLCQRALEEAAVTVSATSRGSGESGITNVQTGGVDEGDIVKLLGRYLVVLRRGRLFTIDLSGPPRLAAMVNAYGEGIEPSGEWYDEMLAFGDRVAVIGYSYRRQGTEIGLFRLGADGSLAWLGTWHLRSNDYYSSENYAARLVGSRLIFYTPLYVRWDGGRPLGSLPGLRRWQPGPDSGGFVPIWTARRVFLPARPLSPGDVALHSVTSCDLAAAELTCESTVVVGPESRSFYVSGTAVYVWMRSWRLGPVDSGSVVVRIPFDAAAPTAVGVRWGPIDQFSFLESADGYLNVLVREAAYGDWMWSPERSAGGGALLRIPLRRFGDGSLTAPGGWYTPLPMPDAGDLTNRFVGDWLLYGRGSGWGSSAPLKGELFLVRWRDGTQRILPLDHPVDRVEAMGSDAVVIGATEKDLRFSGIRLRPWPRAVQRFVVPGAAQGETRSHGFFYRVDGRGEGVIGLPVVRQGREGWRQLFEGSASVLFLRNGGDRFQPLGRLEGDTVRVRDDGCLASCVDWYGNARPLFLRGRIFALLGYELVEGRVRGDTLAEAARVDFAPPRAASRRR